MEAQLDPLVRSIKSDGVESARKEAADIIAQAEEEARRIIAAAEENGRETRRKAEAEAEKLAKTVEDSLRQAARDMVLAVRKELESLFRKLLQQDVANVLSGESLGKVILDLMKGWSAGAAIDVQLSPKDADALAGSLLKKLKDELQDDEFAIRPLEGMKAGLRISFRDGTAYFDFTDEEMSDTLARLLNPKFISYLS
ncbi:MAG: V-type ATP synthase subunit E family protein [Spirochaetota bacterium]